MFELQFAKLDPVQIPEDAEMNGLGAESTSIWPVPCVRHTVDSEGRKGASRNSQLPRYEETAPVPWKEVITKLCLNLQGKKNRQDPESPSSV